MQAQENFAAWPVPVPFFHSTGKASVVPRLPGFAISCNIHNHNKLCVIEIAAGADPLDSIWPLVDNACAVHCRPKRPRMSLMVTYRVKSRCTTVANCQAVKIPLEQAADVPLVNGR